MLCQALQQASGTWAWKDTHEKLNEVSNTYMKIAGLKGSRPGQIGITEGCDCVPIAIPANFFCGSLIEHHLESVTRRKAKRVVRYVDLTPVVFPSEDGFGYTRDVCVGCWTELNGGDRSIQKEQTQRRKR